MRMDGHAYAGAGATALDARGHMERLGLDGLLLHGRAARSMQECVAQNERTLALLRGDGRILGLCVADPGAGGTAVEEVRRCLDAGMAGAGELDPLRQGFAFDDPAFAAIADLLLERGAILSLRLEPGVGAEGSMDALVAFMDFIRKRPAQLVLLTGFGGGLPFYELMGEVRSCLANVFYDTAPGEAAPDGRAAAVTAAILQNGKLLYGSGAALGEGEGGIPPDELAKTLPDAAAADAVLYKNALGLFARAGRETAR